MFKYFLSVNLFFAVLASFTGFCPETEVNIAGNCARTSEIINRSVFHEPCRSCCVEREISWRENAEHKGI